MYRKNFWTGVFFELERLTVLNKKDYKGKIKEGILSAKPY